MQTIKERLVACYMEAGIDFFTASQFATDWLKDLKRQPPGTVWTLGNASRGSMVSVRKD